MKRVFQTVAVLGTLLVPSATGLASSISLSLASADYTAASEQAAAPAIALKNSGMHPAMFSVSVRPTGTQNAVLTSNRPIVTAFPDQLLLMPGKEKTIKLQINGNVRMEQRFDVIVEQSPVMFGSPGAGEAADIMTVKRFVTSITVRPRGEGVTVFASNIAINDTP